MGDGDSMMEDTLLVRHFKSGRAEDFDEIYRQYYKPVSKYINGFIKDRSLAEDLTQDTLIKVLRSLKEVDESRGLSPWIFRIARNTCVDYLRKRKPDCLLEENMGCSVPQYGCPENIILNNEVREKLKEALGMMGLEYRRVLLLRVFDDLSYSDIASRLKLKESAVKTMLHRGRRRLQKLYAQVY